MIEKEKIKVIGFDLDQTLYPKSPKVDAAIQDYIFTVMAREKGYSVAHAKELFNSYYPNISGRQTLLALGFSNGAQIVQESLENADLTEFLEPDEELLKILKELKKHFIIDLITGSERRIAEKKLVKLGIDKSIFHNIITGEVSKSDGNAYKQWIAKYPNLRPESFFYIGDRRSTDIEIPATLGIKGALVNVQNPEEEDEFTSVAELARCFLT